MDAYFDSDIRRASITDTDANGDIRTRHIFAIGYVDTHAEAVTYAVEHIDSDGPITISYATPDGYRCDITYPGPAELHAHGWPIRQPAGGCGGVATR